MTLLMFTCKAGAAGVGDGAAASKVARHLIDLGASLKIRCRWTNMAPLHYAAYFDVGPVLNDLLMASKVSVIQNLIRLKLVTVLFGLFLGSGRGYRLLRV